MNKLNLGLVEYVITNCGYRGNQVYYYSTVLRYTTVCHLRMAT
jgi:hypothetical protein